MKQSLPIYIALLILTFTSCTKKNTIQKETYFGGEIINPHVKYVLLYKENNFIDSIPLDENHKFTYQFKNFEKGLYTFKHDEYQYLYLEPNDSLFLRLNTVEFDETLTFSGKGADKNNFLISTFLKNESEIEQSHDLFKLPPKAFIQNIEDQLKRKHIALERYAEKYLFSEDFITIANAHINYQIYGLKEKYATVNRNKKEFSLPQNYFDYRKNVNFNAIELIDFYPYFNYLNTFVSNIAYTHHACQKPLETYTTKLKVIDTLITNPTIKHNLFQKIGYSYFNRKDSPTNRKMFVTKFSNITKDKTLIAQIKELANKTILVNTGTPFPNFKVHTENNKNVAIQDLLTVPTVLYFWTQKQPRHLKSVHEKVNLIDEKSKYQFIGICVDANNKNWNKVTKRMGFKNDYLIANPIDISQTLMLNSIHKTFVIDANGTILSSDLNLFDVQFEEKLKKL